MLLFFWEVFFDIESGIFFVEWCVGLRLELCDIVLWIDVERSRMWIKYFFLYLFVLGVIVLIRVKVINGVGMILIVIFKLLFIDNIELIKGVVIVGNILEIEYLCKEEFVMVDWSGFFD